MKDISYFVSQNLLFHFKSVRFGLFRLQSLSRNDSIFRRNILYKYTAKNQISLLLKKGKFIFFGIKQVRRVLMKPVRNSSGHFTSETSFFNQASSISHARNGSSHNFTTMQHKNMSHASHFSCAREQPKLSLERSLSTEEISSALTLDDIIWEKNSTVPEHKMAKKLFDASPWDENSNSSLSTDRVIFNMLAQPAPHYSNQMEFLWPSPIESLEKNYLFNSSLEYHKNGKEVFSNFSENKQYKRPYSYDEVLSTPFLSNRLLLEDTFKEVERLCGAKTAKVLPFKTKLLIARNALRTVEQVIFASSKLNSIVKNQKEHTKSPFNSQNQRRCNRNMDWRSILNATNFVPEVSPRLKAAFCKRMQNTFVAANDQQS